MNSGPDFRAVAFSGYYVAFYPPRCAEKIFGKIKLIREILYSY